MVEHLRILLTTPYDLDVPGGVNNQLWGLYTYLKETAGAQVRIVGPASRSTSFPDADVVPLGKVRRLRMNGAVSNLTLDLSIRHRVRHLLHTFAPDIVHLQEPFAPVLNTFVLKHSRSVNVATFHTCGENHLGYALAWPFLRYQLRRIHLRIAVSDTARRYVARLFPGPYHLVPNAIDLSRTASPTADLFSHDRKNLLFVGRINEQRKGFGHLLAAYALLEKRVPGQYRLVVAGPGSSSLQAADHPGDVRPLGELSDRDLHSVYADCDLLCAPSVAGESFGLVLLEAFSHGKPVIAFNIPGYSELIGDCPAACLVRPGDESGLAAAMDDVCRDDQRYRAMSSAARQLASRHDWRQIGPRITALYETALARHLSVEV
jgi:phosphatidyl-myo-inositol alpha-mannosyltransferase